MEMTGFLDYCAELGLKAAEITGYFFPEPLGHVEIHAVRRRAHLLGFASRVAGIYDAVIKRSITHAGIEGFL